VTHIKYTDTDGALQTLSSSRYVVDTACKPGRIIPAYNDYWPSTRDIPNAVTVRFVAGWLTPEDVPEPLKHALKIQALTLYEHREEFVIGESFDELPVVKRLIADYRMYGVV
jgi:uncharacterized phiE125 gp8 family phage protein